tara:strand:+ start:739 stop:1059 length:321 start_codon:yes stop_codon:yes gene_type:complete
MRVKLSYTVDSEDVLREAAKMLGLAGDDVKQVIEVFNAIPVELSKKGEADPPNVFKALEMIEEMRKALLAVDTRLLEVADIVESYDRYRTGAPLEEALPEGIQADQ